MVMRSPGSVQRVRWTGSVPVTRMPPAQLTVRTPSSSESRLMSVLPCRQRRIQCGGAEEARLLICCENGLQSRVGQGFVLQNGQDHGDGDAIVRAEGRPIGGEPVAFQLQAQRVLGEV